MECNRVRDDGNRVEQQEMRLKVYVMLGTSLRLSDRVAAQPRSPQEDSTMQRSHSSALEKGE